MQPETQANPVVEGNGCDDVSRKTYEAGCSIALMLDGVRRQDQISTNALFLLRVRY